ncbi:MAG: helix-turn-helix domain-containing protein [Acidimicrobiales bacterium]
MDKLLLTPEDAAEVLSIGRTKLYELLAAGLIGSVRIGGCRRVPTAALADYVSRLSLPEAGRSDGPAARWDRAG